MNKKELELKVRELYENGDAYNLYDLEDNIGGDVEEVANEQNVEKHRHYETALLVARCSDGLVGIRLPSQIYSESSQWEDLYYSPRIFDVKAEQTVKYAEVDKH